MEKVQYKRILVTHDGSHLASAALPHAAAIAKACKAEVFLLHVIESFEYQTISMNPVETSMYPIPLDMASDTVKKNRRTSKQQLEEIKSELEHESVTTVNICVEEGFTRDIILDVAKTKHCDLIVISSRGRSGLGRILLGSVADYVIRHAPCPVLVIHPEKESA